MEQLCHEKDTHKFDLHCSSQPRILSDGHIRISVPGVSNKRPLLHENMRIQFCLQKELLLPDLIENAKGYHRAGHLVASERFDFAYRDLQHDMNILKQKMNNASSKTRPESWHTANLDPIESNVILDPKGDYVHFIGRVVNVNVKTEQVVVQIPCLYAEECPQYQNTAEQTLPYDIIFGGVLRKYFQRLDDSPIQ